MHKILLHYCKCLFTPAIPDGLCWSMSAWEKLPEQQFERLAINISRFNLARNIVHKNNVFGVNDVFVHRGVAFYCFGFNVWQKRKGKKGAARNIARSRKKTNDISVCEKLANFFRVWLMNDGKKMPVYLKNVIKILFKGTAGDVYLVLSLIVSSIFQNTTGSDVCVIDGNIFKTRSLRKGATSKREIITQKCHRNQEKAW